jgi:hypothetical protein
MDMPHSLQKTDTMVDAPSLVSRLTADTAWTPMLLEPEASRRKPSEQPNVFHNMDT